VIKTSTLPQVHKVHRTGENVLEKRAVIRCPITEKLSVYPKCTRFSKCTAKNNRVFLMTLSAQTFLFYTYIPIAKDKIILYSICK